MKGFIKPKKDLQFVRVEDRTSREEFAEILQFFGNAKNFIFTNDRMYYKAGSSHQPVKNGHYLILKGGILQVLTEELFNSYYTIIE